MGSSFVLFYVSMEITLGRIWSGESGYTSLPVSKCCLPMGKRACVSTTIVSVKFKTSLTPPAQQPKITDVMNFKLRPPAATSLYPLT